MHYRRKKLDVVLIYDVLVSPSPLQARDIDELFGCTRATSLKYMRQVQDYISAKEGKPCSSHSVLREWVLNYEGWEWEYIRREALAIMATQNGKLAAAQ